MVTILSFCITVRCLVYYRSICYFLNNLYVYCQNISSFVLQFTGFYMVDLLICYSLDFFLLQLYKLQKSFCVQFIIIFSQF